MVLKPVVCSKGAFIKVKIKIGERQTDNIFSVVISIVAQNCMVV